MSPGRRGTGLARRLRLPRRTIRLRLALLYGGLFFISGAVLLGITFVGVARTHGSYSRAVAAPFGSSQSHAAEPGEQGSEEASSSHPHEVRVFDSGQHGADVRVLAIVSVVALAAMAAVSMGLGWLMAGRVLRPLTTITSAAREISATDLHRRLALAGPNDEFKELGDTFDGLLARLESSFRAQRQFVANASHELRTPLARLKTLAQVAIADPNASVGSLRAAHERVLASEQQLEALIDALLSLASGERGLHRHEAIDLAALTSALLTDRREEIERRGLRLRSTLGAADAEGDARLVERLIANLIDNAIRHNVAGGSIDVLTTSAAGVPVLSVTNDGPTIAEEDLERLRAPFERLGASRTGRGDRHGLGLSIVQAIAAAHEAQLEIRARPEGGLAVEVRFRPARDRTI